MTNDSIPEEVKEVADEIEKTLNDRGETYGDYDQMSECITELQRMIGRYQPKPAHMTNGQYHALGMIMVKAGRIITGDPNHKDSWLDIAGYAKLAAKDL
jgi:hypothetical protein